MRGLLGRWISGLLAVLYLNVFVLFTSTSLLLADEPPGDGDQHLSGSRVIDWEEQILHSHDSDGVDGLAKIPLPDDVLQSVLRYSGRQTGKFYARFRDDYLAKAGTYFPYYFKDKVSEAGKPVTEAEYTSTLRTVLVHISEKRERFERGDPVGLYRLGLKILFMIDHDKKAWEAFRDQFKKDLSSSMPALEIAGQDPTSADYKAKRLEIFWAQLQISLRKYFAEKASAGEIDVEIKAKTFAERVKVVGDLLIAHKPSELQFFVGLKVAHLFHFGPSALESDTWRAFAKNVNKEHESEIPRITRRFLGEAASGKLKALMGSEEDIQVRFDVISSGGVFHLVTRIGVAGSDGRIIVINPPSPLKDDRLNPNDWNLKKYVMRLKTNVIVLDWQDLTPPSTNGNGNGHGKSHGLGEDLGALKIVNVFSRSPWWDPIQFLKDHFIYAFEKGSKATIFLAGLSVLINGGARILGLHKAAEIMPDQVHFSWEAVALVVVYFAYTAGFPRWYDNIIASKHAWLETTKKIIFAMPFTTLGFMALTMDQPILILFLLSLPMAVLEKLGSTYNRQLIRYMETEKIIDGDLVVRSGHLNLQIVRDLQNVSDAAFKESERSNLELRRNLNPLERRQRISELLKLSTAEHLEWMSGPSADDLEEIEIPEVDLSFEDAQELIEASTRGAKAHSPLEAIGPRPSHTILPYEQSRVLVRAEQGVVIREVEGYLRNGAVSVGTTISPSFGLSFQVLLGFFCNTLSFIYTLREKSKAKAEGNIAQTRYYEGKLDEIKGNYFAIPGLYGGLKLLGRKVKATCRSIVSSSSSSPKQ